MTRLGVVALLIPALAIAQGFTFEVARPVASQDFHFKTAAFVFRTQGCSVAKPNLSATAEGIDNHERRSLPLKVMGGSKPGVYAVFQTWPNTGHWVVNLEGTCGNSSAGAILPIGPKGFIRDSAKFFPHPASKSEVDASLEAVARRGSK
jgi:hypothetical protein